MQGAAVFIFGGCLRPDLHCAIWQDGNVRYTHSCASNVKCIENDDFRVFFDTFRVFAVDSASKQGDPNVRKYRK